MPRRVPKTSSRRTEKQGARLELKRLYMIAQTLSQQDESLYDKVSQLYLALTKNDMIDFQTLPIFTTHGRRHIGLVLDRASQLLAGCSAKAKLSAGENYLLIVSILLHDCGYIPYKFLSESPIDAHKKHGSRTKETIESMAAQLGLNTQETPLVANIAASHCYDDYHSMAEELWSLEELGRCRVHIVMAILRISDLLDITYSRAPELVFGLRELPVESKTHYERHAAIDNVEIDHKEWTIRVYASPRSVKQELKLEQFRQWLEVELSAASKDLKKIGLMYTRVDLKVNDSNIRQWVNPTPRHNPYRGLYAFEARDSESFFARDREIEMFSKLIEQRPFITMVGASGVGKTSLVNAGVLPRLTQMNWSIARTRLNAPVRENIISVLGSALNNRQEPTIESVQRALLKLKRKRRECVLYLDQFEELFTLSSLESEQDSLLEILDDLMRANENFHVLISIRSEFFYDLWKIAKKRPAFLKIDSEDQVAKLGREDARQAIELPMLAFKNLRWDPALVETMLDELTDENAGVYPPYLQLLCFKLVEAKFKDIQRLSMEERRVTFKIGVPLYELLGGADTIINDHFQDILRKFSTIESEVLKSVLSRMITEYNSRRPIHREEVSNINQGRIDIEKAMQRLVDARIVSRVYFGYELVHDLVAKKLMTLVEGRGRLSTRLRAVKTYIEAHLTQQITVDELAKIATLSPSQFTRRFKAEFGSSPTQYILSERIREARWRLTETEDPISDIAKNCGFPSASRFRAVFKKFSHDMTPREYRVRSRIGRDAEYD